jgi:glycosyltransferase involved in cell wall biosynthesis
MRFVQSALSRVAERSISIVPYFVLDVPDDLTRTLVRRVSSTIPNSRVLEVDCANLGASRTEGLNASSEEFVFFLDGDDFVSFNWFESALEFLSSFGQDRDKIVAHTEHFVGFDRESFVRVGVDSRELTFDPYVLAADWFFCNNLACSRKIFEQVPIEPYAHSEGFGAEDWHWSCETLARGFHHAIVPATSYFYRIKPQRFSLGRSGTELIHRRSSLFDLEIGPQSTGVEPPQEKLPELDDLFFSEAEQLVPFDNGLTYLRAVKAKAKGINHFKRQLPYSVGNTWRSFLRCRGSSDEVCIIYADLERLPGGSSRVTQIAMSLLRTNGISDCPIFIVLEGVGDGLCAEDSTVALRLDDLRAEGCSDQQLARLVARMFIQTHKTHVINFVSPRKSSLATSFSLAKSHSIASWWNVVLEFGLDYFAATISELRNVLETNISNKTACIFEKTALELAQSSIVAVMHSETLEQAYVSDGLCSAGLELNDLRMITGEDGKQAAPKLVSVNATGHIERNDELEAALNSQEFVLISIGDHTFVPNWDWSRYTRLAQGGAAVRIPALTLIDRGGSMLYYRPDLRRLNEMSRRRGIPTNLFDSGVLCIRSEALNAQLAESDELDLVAVLDALRLTCKQEDWIGLIDRQSIVVQAQDRLSAGRRSSLINRALTLSAADA